MKVIIVNILINPEIVFKRSCSNEDILQFLKNQKYSFCKAQPSFYCQKIVNMWAYPDFLKLMKTIAESSLFLEELERFSISLGSEFGLIWLHQYILEPELSRKKQLEEKLLSLPNKALILAGQRAFILVKNLSLPKIIAAYTLASTKRNRLKESIDALVRHSIQRKKTNVFETLLRPVWGK